MSGTEHPLRRAWGEAEGPLAALLAASRDEQGEADRRLEDLVASLRARVMGLAARSRGSSEPAPSGASSPSEPSGASSPSEPSEGSSPLEPSEGSRPSEPSGASVPSEPSGASVPSEPSEEASGPAEPSAPIEVPVAAPLQAGPAAPRAAPPKGRAPTPLPNAHQGRPYQALLDAPGLIELKQLEVDPALGIQLKDGALSGTPNEAGDFELVVQGTDAEGSPAARRFSLIVNPDPRRLWTEREPEDLRHAKPHLDARRLDEPTAIALAGSRRGRAHAHAAEYREDDVEVARAEGWWVVAVSDGAGSAELSRVGSKLVVEGASRAAQTALSNNPSAWIEAAAAGEQGLKHHASEMLLPRLRAHVIEPLVHRASELGVPLEQLSATLLLTLGRPLGGGRWAWVGFGVGDGASAVVASSGEPTLLCHPDGGPFAGQTRFVNGGGLWDDPEELSRRIIVSIGPAPRALLVMSDGVSDPKIPSERAMGEAATWTALLEELEAEVGLGPEAEQRLLEWLSFFKPGEHDDRTLVWLSPQPEVR